MSGRALPRLRPETIVRDRVTRRLTEAEGCPLTVVCAPAGYGKTTALVTWLAGRDDPAAWVSLDHRDDDPRRLCEHLLAALNRALPSATIEAERALLGGSDLVETVIPLMVASIDELGGERLVVIFDDCHAVTATDSHAVLRALIDGVPHGVQVVLASRRAVPVPLGRRRVAGTVVEVGPTDLAFDAAEAALLLNGWRGLGLTAEQIATIQGRVDGWPAGLTLIAASIPAGGPGGSRDAFLHAFEDSRRAVEEYLIEEVFEGLAPRMQSFLCRTSILERLSPSLCQAVLEDPEAGELLAEARRSNLFVTALDGDWVRYHQLFAALLQRQLDRCSPDLVAELHLRASRWFERTGLIEDAIAHASAAGDGVRGARLLFDNWPGLLNRRRYVPMQLLLAGLPADRGDLDGFCAALQVLCAAFDGVDQVVVHERLQALQSRREEPGVAGLIDGMLVWPFYGHVGEAAAVGRRLLDGHRAPPTMPLRIASQLAVVLWFAGDGAGVRALLEPRLSLMVDMPTTRAWALATLALTELDDGDAEQAERYAAEALGLLKSGGGQSAIEAGLVYDAIGAALTARGRLQAAQQAFCSAQSVERQPGSVSMALTLILEAELWLSRRDRRHARELAIRARRIVDRYPDVGVLTDRLARIEAAVKTLGSDDLAGSPPTRSEQRVLELLATDLTNRQIAERLYLSNETVRSHLRHLYRRLGVRTRHDAVDIARERGLLETAPDASGA